MTASVDAACTAAAAASEDYGRRPDAARAAFLRAAAGAIEARGTEITAAGTEETGLPEARLEGERGRTCGQLRLFAEFVEAGHHREERRDAALADRAPLPRPELRLVMRPIGPVAVFGASNFPLAFSTAGGDTASALAAGCPVVVKGHPAHPRTAALVAEAVTEAARATGMPRGTFAQVDDPEGDHAVGAALVRHPAIRAAGFTGSLRGGRALFDIACARPDPIPFSGELGSVNPVFVLPAAAEARGADIARGWVASLTMGAGQFCTNPGVIVVPEAQADAFAEAARAAAAQIAPQTMLTDGIARAYRAGVDAARAAPGVTVSHAAQARGRAAGPVLLRLAAADAIARPEILEEVFGPMGVVVCVRDDAEAEALARALPGQLTATLQMDEADHPQARALMPALEAMAGRILANGFPTGVEVAHAMMHGGPWPATTDPRFTSVGTLAIRRWQRPVCHQDVPEAIL